MATQRNVGVPLSKRPRQPRNQESRAYLLCAPRIGRATDFAHRSYARRAWRCATEVLASQDFKHARKGAGQAVKCHLSLRRTCNGRPADNPLRRIGSYSCDQEMRALGCVVVAVRVRRTNEMRVRMQEYRCFPLAAVHVLTSGGHHSGALACDSEIFPTWE